MSCVTTTRTLVAPGFGASIRMLTFGRTKLWTKTLSK